MSLTAVAVAVAVQVLVWTLAAIYGTRVAQWRMNRRYARAELRSRERACDLTDLSYLRRKELADSEYEQRQRHSARKRELYNWSRQYNDLLTQTKERK